MRLAAIDRMTPPMPDFSARVIRIEQHPSRRSAAAFLVLFALLAALTLAPFYLLASGALADEDVRAAMATQPLAAAQALAGLGLWLVLTGLPMTRLLGSLTRSRSVEIADGTVTVNDRGFSCRRIWQARLAEFCGVTPYLRASLSGVRHEVILLHPDRERSVLIALTNGLRQPDLDRITAALGLPELPPRALHRREGWSQGVVGQRASEPSIAPATV